MIVGPANSACSVTYAAGASGYSPATLNPYVWLPAGGTYEVVADQEPPAEPGEPVGRWKDGGTGGRNGNQTTAGKRPLRAADGRGVTGDGVNDTLVITNGCPDPAVNGLTLFFKVKRANTSATGESVIDLFGQPNQSRIGVFGGGGSNELAWFNGATIYTFGAASAAEQVLGMTVTTGGDVTLYRADGSTTTGGTWFGPSGAATTYLLSRLNTDGFSNATLIDYEMYNAVLTAGQIANTRNYMAGV